MRLIYTLLLVAVTAVWGWTFVVVQDAISVYGVIPFLSVRIPVGRPGITTSRLHVPDVKDKINSVPAAVIITTIHPN